MVSKRLLMLTETYEMWNKAKHTRTPKRIWGRKRTDTGRKREGNAADKYVQGQRV